MLMAATLLTASFAQEKRYGVERAILQKNTVIGSMGVTQQTLSSIQYIDDYGRRESSETFMGVQGQMFTIFTLMKDGYAYTANMAAKQGAKINMAAMTDGKTINYLNLTDEVKQKYQIEEKGNEQLLGKDCKLYGVTVTVQGQNVKGTVWVWQGLPLKSSMNVAGNTVVEEVIEIREGAEIPKEKFELPEGINFVEVKPQM